MLELIKDLVDAKQRSSDDFYELLILTYLKFLDLDKGIIISANQEGKPYTVSSSGFEESGGNKHYKFYLENYNNLISDFSKNESGDNFGIYERKGVLLIVFFCSFKGLLVLVGNSAGQNQAESDTLRSFTGVAVRLIDLFNERQQLENKITGLREENERKGSYLINFAHELKTPVNAIAGFAHLLKEPELKHDNLRKYINIISDTSENLISVIGYLNAIAEIESGSIKAVDNIVDMQALIEDVFNKFYLRFSKKNILLEKQVSPKDGLIPVKTDEAKVRQVLNTLVLNALNNTFRGRVRISCRLMNGCIEFSVADTGTGMSPEKKSGIFDFRALNSTYTNNSEGSGLGLVIARSYIQVLGGSMRCESQEGAGTEFFFSIPYNPASAATGTTDLHKEKKAEPDISSRKKILVAEDDNLNFYLISSFLSNLNIEIIRAMNGQEAVDICKTVDFDLILMDIRMPVMDGYKAAKLIRELNPEIKIIVQTAFSNDRSIALENGCSDFIAKPFNRNQLLSIVSAYLECQPIA